MDPSGLKHFRRIRQGLDVAPILSELNAAPLLWNQYPLRTRPGSPHYGVPDIWLRYCAPDKIGGKDFAQRPHEPIWYPAAEALPSAVRLCERIAREEEVDFLGGILITQIPPGGMVRPHHDKGTWHSEWCNFKVYIPLQTNEFCTNHCEDEAVIMKSGDGWTFDNLFMHWVTNAGANPRMTLIISMRRGDLRFLSRPPQSQQ